MADAEADPLYDQAVDIVVKSRRASISLVQRNLRIGYNRAARLVEQMEKAGHRHADAEQRQPRSAGSQPRCLRQRTRPYNLIYSIQSICYINHSLPLCTLLLATAAHAGASDKLRNFISASQSGQANFTQVVQDKKGKKIQSASGTMQFVRPGKFRWVYQKPYEQIIVGDGKKFWLYDVDLNQVTVKKLDAALGSSPAALLSGNNEIERSFVLQDSGTQRRPGVAGCNRQSARYRL